MLVIRNTQEAARRVWADSLASQGAQYEEGPEVWLGSPRQIADRVTAFRSRGFHTVIAEIAPPYDAETIDRFIGEVRPQVLADRGYGRERPDLQGASLGPRGR